MRVTRAALLGGRRRDERAASRSRVPLYRIFCQATGYGGTTQRGRAPRRRRDRQAASSPCASMPTVAPDLPWDFAPEQRSGHGPSRRAEARSPIAPSTVGRADHRHAPPTTSRPTRPGSISTSCNASASREQHLAPGESADLTVTFFVDPDIVKDPDDLRRRHDHSLLHHVPRQGRRAARRQAPSPSPSRPSTDLERPDRDHAHQPRRAQASLSPRRSQPVADRRRASRRPAGRRRRDVHAWRRLADHGDGARLPPRARRHGGVVARRDPRGGLRRPSHPRRADRPALRHGAVHRLGGDVLRGLLLGVLQRRRSSRPTATAASGRPRASTPSIRSICRSSTRWSCCCRARR